MSENYLQARTCTKGFRQNLGISSVYSTPRFSITEEQKKKDLYSHKSRSSTYLSSHYPSTIITIPYPNIIAKFIANLRVSKCINWVQSGKYLCAQCLRDKRLRNPEGLLSQILKKPFQGRFIIMPQVVNIRIFSADVVR